MVTLAVDEATQLRWDDLRSRHFPADRLVVGAHVTLFHALPSERLDATLDTVREIAAATHPFAITEEQPYSLGRGVALRVTSAVLAGVHAELASRWAPWLTRQDSQPFRPHVTVQNKVAPEVARATQAELSASLTGWSGTGAGIALWRYEGGPWSAVDTVPFG